jgi:hypothetical protein
MEKGDGIKILKSHGFHVGGDWAELVSAVNNVNLKGINSITNPSH